MSRRQEQALAQYLELLHETPEFTGLADFHQRYQDRLPNVRTIYRWHRTRQVGYHPNIRYGALGLLRCHLLITRDPENWLGCPYAVRATWVRDGLGARALYLECLVPPTHMAALRTRASVITTDDPWQLFQVTRSTRSTPTPELPPFEDLRTVFPLVIPVACEALRGRQSLDELWRAIYTRLGPRVWQYLPRGLRRLPHNGKRYVRIALARLGSAGLIRQNVIEYQAPDHLEVIITASIAPDDLPEWVERLRNVAPNVVLYDGKTTVFRISANVRTLRELLTLTEHRPARLYLAERTVPVQFQYEQFFDPLTRDWVLP